MNICSALSGRLCQIVAGFAFAAAVILSARASAEILDLAPNGFTLRENIHVAADPAKVYDALVVPRHWWSSKHTFSGNAENLSLDARAGGCWCEALPGGGSVQHMTVVVVDPGKSLRLRGALGPFQAMGVDGALTYSLAAAPGGTDVTLVNTIGGYTKGGFDAIAHAADAVLGEQLARLKSYVETGNPEMHEEAKP